MVGLEMVVFLKIIFPLRIKLYFWGLLCYLSLKTGIGNYTIGSNLDVYARKIK